MNGSLRLCAWVAILAVATPVAAQDWDTYPALPTDSSLGIKVTLDNPAWARTRECLASTESAVDARYYAVVVDVSDAGGAASPSANNAVPYVDAVYQYWKPGGRVPADKHVLIALALKNRAVAIHPGTDWTDLGFRRGLITQTIDGSEFKKHARNGDYPEAVCALVRAVDTQLARLAATRKKRLQDASARADKITASTPALRDEIEAATKDRPEARAAFLAHLEQLLDAAAGAREQAAAGRADLAGSAADRAEKLAASLHGKLTRIPEIDAAVADLRDEIRAHQDALAQRSDVTWAGPKAASQTLQRCQVLADDAATAVDEGHPERVALAALPACADSVDTILAASDIRYVVYTRVLPIGGLLFALFALGIVLLFMLRRRHLLVERLDDRLEQWEKKLGMAAQRVLAMEERHPLYFAAGSLRYTGKTEPLDRAAAESVNHVFLLLDRARDLTQQARTLRGAGGPLSTEPVVGALALLSTETVRIETGDREPRRRIFLPLEEAYEGSANELLEHLDATYATAMLCLDQLQEAVAAVQELSSDIARTHDRGARACARRAEMGLDAGHLQHALVAATDGLEDAEDAAVLDPAEAAEPLRAILERLRDLAGRAEAGNDVMAQLRGPVRELGKSLRATVHRLRAEGFRLDEPGLGSETRLDDRSTDAQRIAPLLDEGELQGARTLLDTIATDLQYLSEQLTATEAAREGVPNAVERAMSARDRLQARVPNAREVLDTLTSDHDPATFSQEADNLDELVDTLLALEKWRRKVSAAHAAQRYLEATREIRGCEAFLERGQGLLDAIDQVQSELNGAREQAKAAWHGIASLQKQAVEEIGRDDARPGAHGHTHHSHLVATTQPHAATLDRPKPNWPKLSVELDELHGQWELHHQQLVSSRRAFARASETVATVHTDLRRLAQAVASERRDRPHVAAAVGSALDDLALWEESAADEGRSGVDLLDVALGFQERAAWAHATWKRELQAIANAQSESLAAARQLARLEAVDYGWGVAARLAHLRKLQSDLEAQRDAGSFEEMVHTARRLREAALQEERRCERRVREEREEARRRDAARLEALRRATARRATSSWSSSHSSSSTSSASSGAFGSSSGGSSFSSSSGGSGFGSSNSGGSSW